MKKIFILVIVVLSFSFVNASVVSKQGAEKANVKKHAAVVGDSCDVIVLKNGDEILAKVLEIGDEEIKYKLYSNLSGPIYSKKKADILFVKYSNGTKEVFTEVKKKGLDYSEKLHVEGSFFPKYYKGNDKISKNRFIDELKSYYKSKSYLSSYSGLTVVAILFYALGAFVFLFFSMLLGVFLYVIGLIVALIAGGSFEKAIDAYNEHLE